MHWRDRNEMYVGNWEDGIQHGMGQYIWFVPRVKGSQYSLRNVYDGQFFKGRRHGYGVFYYPNGARYEGDWESDLKWGKVTSFSFFSRVFFHSEFIWRNDFLVKNGLNFFVGKIHFQKRTCVRRGIWKRPHQGTARSSPRWTNHTGLHPTDAFPDALWWVSVLVRDFCAAKMFLISKL